MFTKYIIFLFQKRFLQQNYLWTLNFQNKTILDNFRIFSLQCTGCAVKCIDGNLTPVIDTWRKCVIVSRRVVVKGINSHVAPKI
jgi:hypothetical protein